MHRHLYLFIPYTEQEHRFRALFPLEMMLDTIGQHRGAYWLIVNRLLLTLALILSRTTVAEARASLVWVYRC